MRPFGRGVGRWSLGILAAASLVVVACSSGEGTSAPDASAPPGTEVGAPGAEIDRDAVVKVGYDLAQDGAGRFVLDPADGRGSVDTNDALQYWIFGRLLRPLPGGGYAPDLAESVTIVDDSTIEIVVRKGSTFHDGAPFDAAAVKAGFDRTLETKNEDGLTPAFFSLESVEVTGPDTVTLTIPDGTARSWHDSFLGKRQGTIVRPGTDFEHPIGAGPMRVVRYTPRESMTLERYEGYWDADSVNFAGIELVNLSASQPQSGVAALRAGQVDIIQTEVSQIGAITGNLEWVAEPEEGQLITMQLCKRDGPLADSRVRKAINKAIDREALSDVVFAGTAIPAHQLWAPGSRFHDPEVDDELAYDPEATRQLLADAGYPDGIEFDAYVLPSLSLPEVAEVIQPQLAEVGITMNILLTPDIVNGFMTPSRPGAGLIPLLPEGRVKLEQWRGDAISNTCGFEDPQIDTFATELSSVSDSSEEAVEIWHDVADHVTNEALSVLLVFGSRIGAYDSDVLSDVVRYPKGTFFVPDIFTTYTPAA